MQIYFRFIRSSFFLLQIFLSYSAHFLLARIFSCKSRKLNSAENEHTRPNWIRKRKDKIDEKNARRLLKYFHSLGGIFIKLGQLFSMFEGPIPKAYTKKLKTLQDQIPPTPFSTIEKCLIQAWGNDYAEKISHIDPKPISSASFGQVHVGILKNGQKVAIKVLYPHVRKTIHLDLKIIHMGFRIYNLFVPVQNLSKAAFKKLEDMIHREIHYLNEAQCIRRFSKCLEDETDIITPQVIDALTTNEVLVMTFMEGFKITDKDACAKHGIDTEHIAKRIIQLSLTNLFKHQLIHVDPHPANFLIQPKEDPTQPNIVILDMGSVSEVDDSMLAGLQYLIVGMLMQNIPTILQGIQKLGFVSEKGEPGFLEDEAKKHLIKSMKKPARTMGEIIEKSDSDDTEPEMSPQKKRKILKSIKYPENWFYVERAGLMTFWLVAQIHPETKLFDVAMPTLMELINQPAKA